MCAKTCDLAQTYTHNVRTEACWCMGGPFIFGTGFPMPLRVIIRAFKTCQFSFARVSSQRIITLASITGIIIVLDNCVGISQSHVQLTSSCMGISLTPRKQGRLGLGVDNHRGSIIQVSRQIILCIASAWSRVANQPLYQRPSFLVQVYVFAYVEDIAKVCYPRCQKHPAESLWV